MDNYFQEQADKILISLASCVIRCPCSSILVHVCTGTGVWELARSGCSHTGEGLGWLCAATSAFQSWGGVPGASALSWRSSGGKKMGGGDRTSIWGSSVLPLRGLVVWKMLGWGLLSSGSQKCHRNVTNVTSMGTPNLQPFPCRNSCAAQPEAAPSHPSTHLGEDPKPSLAPEPDFGAAPCPFVLF